VSFLLAGLVIQGGRIVLQASAWILAKCHYAFRMKTSFYFSLLGALFLLGCGEKQPATAQATNSPGSNPLNAPADYVGALGRGQATAIKTIDVASLNQALQMFNVQEGRFPKDLNELVDSKLIGKVPAAPYGKKLVYDASAGKVSVVDQ
jgi:hypothetical protein